MQPVQTKSIVLTPTFWLSTIQAIGSALVIFQAHYPSIGWLGLAIAVIHALLPTTQTQPVSLFGGIKLRKAQ